ncbi:Aminotransferase [Apiospora sp. TS-2023a]
MSKVAFRGDLGDLAGALSLAVKGTDNGDGAHAGLYIEVKDPKANESRNVLDMCGGAAVACLGNGKTRHTEKVLDAMHEQNKKLSYAAHGFYSSGPARDLAARLLQDANEPSVEGSDEELTHVMVLSSGSEINEAAIKLVLQYWNKKAVEAEEAGKTPEKRDIILSRYSSYHGNTLDALAMSEFPVRREIYENFLDKEHFKKVGRFYPYRDQGKMSDDQYDQYLLDQLRDTIEVYKTRVAAFVLEPVSGAALGSQLASVKYLQGVKNICNEKGVLLIYDEVMCGIGRTGYINAWHYYNEKSKSQFDRTKGFTSVAPDMMTVAKGLGAGITQVSALLANKKVAEQISGWKRPKDVVEPDAEREPDIDEFIHGHTYQSHLGACAAALVVQESINTDFLLNNIRERGEQIGQRLKALAEQHPNVGDVRGRGLFWGVEFIQNKASGKFFDYDVGAALAKFGRTHKKGFCKGLNTDDKVNEAKGTPLTVYPGAWKMVDDVSNLVNDHRERRGARKLTTKEQQTTGSHVIIAPAFYVTEAIVVEMMDKFFELVNEFFKKDHLTEMVTWKRPS